MEKDIKRGRVAERIKEILSQLIQFEVSDPRLAGTNVIDVEIDRELMYATVFVTDIEGEEARDTVLEGLSAAGGYLRRELASRMRLRRVPELRWEWDETATYGSRIDELLDSIHIPSDSEENGDDAQ